MGTLPSRGQGAQAAAMKSIMRWGKAALSRVEEAVAPLNSLPPEKAFERSWSAVVDFYHQVAASDDGDPLASEETLGKSNIMHHLDKMVQLLKDEEQHCRSTMTEGDVGPCMMLLLQKKIVDNLCALGQADRPPGMMPLVLDTMQQILQCSRQGLMDHHNQINDPVHKLIQSAVTVQGNSNLKVRLMHLVQTMFRKIHHKPELMEYSVKRNEEGELTEFLMFTTLVEHINDPDATGMHARAGAIQGIKMARRDESLLRFIAQTTTFCSDVAIGIANAYSAVYQMGKDQFAEAERHGAADYLRDQITFLSALGQCEPEPAVAIELLQQLDTVFVEPVLIQSMLDSSAHNLPFALDLCQALISQLGPSSIRTRIICKLLHHAAVRSLLCSSIASEDPLVQQSCLQLFASIVATRDETVIAELLFCAAEERDAECGTIQNTLNAHLKLDAPSEENEKMMKDYREEAEAQLYLWEQYAPTKEQLVPLMPAEQDNFVTKVLAEFGSLLFKDFNVAVVLTGIMTMLVQCPETSLHRHLFGGGAESRLAAAVAQGCEAVQALLQQTPDAENVLLMVKNRLEQSAGAQREEDPTVAQFKNVVVWQEFSKELLATIEMKTMMFAMRME